MPYRLPQELPRYVQHNVLYGFDPSKALYLAVHRIKSICCNEHALPRILVITGHVVVCMVTGYDRE